MIESVEETAAQQMWDILGTGKGEDTYFPFREAWSLILFRINCVSVSAFVFVCVCVRR